ncbi:MAG: RIP metalloprotease RseP [Clostridia bacterium]|nr:RIP metalloprotease RseP [Clostridia bacterium]
MILTVIFAVICFSLIIFVHELGHFLTARLFGVRVHEFALGMGPKIFSKKRGETLYSIRAIPLGGFCSMEGEDTESDDEGSFSKKPRYARFIILAAGASMNIILGFLVCIIYVAVAFGPSGLPSVTVDSVLAESDLADFLQPGDRIVRINDSKVNIKRDIDFAMQRAAGKESHITVSRDGELLSAEFVPYVSQYTDGTPAYLLGVMTRSEKANVFNVIREAFYQTIWSGKLVFVSLGMLLGGETGLSDMSGPVGVVGVMNEAASQGGLVGLLNLLYLMSFISVNIGIMNLLPIPALDGGRLFFVVVEAIRRKPIPADKEGIVHFIGLVFLLGLMVFVTWNDISRLFFGG